MMISSRLTSVSLREPAAAFQNDFDGLTYAYAFCSTELAQTSDINEVARHVQGCEECLDFLARREMFKRLPLKRLN